MMWCDTCGTSVHAPSGICDTCGEDLLGFGQSAVFEDPCVICKTGIALAYCDVCEDCYNMVASADRDAYPEICQVCCSMLLLAGQECCDVCDMDSAAAVSGKGYDRYGGYDWWTGEESVELPIPPVEQELELIPALRKA